MQNILTNSVRAIGLKLKNDEYLDTMLYKGEAIDNSLEDYEENCLAMEITPECFNGLRYFSSRYWDRAKNGGVRLENIGFTGVDNGLIFYRKDKITNEQFFNIFTGSSMTIDEGDNATFLTPVEGNIGIYNYPMGNSEDNSYMSFKGGFLQGFFKIDGMDYQTLPTKIEDEWCMHFVLRKRDYEEDGDTLNKAHPENKGLFFYMGTRAENKFWKYYNYDEEELKPYKNPEYTEEDYYDKKEDCHVSNCDYMGKDEEGNYPWTPSYIKKDIKILSDDFKTKDGIDADNEWYTEIETDNKFLLFDRTENGYTVSKWGEEEENAKFILTGTSKPNINLFPYMNRTSTGYTVHNVDELYETMGDKYDLFKDIINNSFSLKINDDGSIGYRYGVLDCTSDTRYSIIEEYSDANLIKVDEWASVVVRLIALTSQDACEDKKGRKMKLQFYVNGKLVFISKELPVLDFKALDETHQKQEGVPYSISLGGGTQGLCEVVYPDYYANPKYILPIEKNFGGTFIGDIKSFKFYTCPADFTLVSKMKTE